jgi:hypothetical protein
MAIAALDPQAWAIETIGRIGGAGAAVGEDAWGVAPRGADVTPQLAVTRTTSKSAAVVSKRPEAIELRLPAVHREGAREGVIGRLAASLQVDSPGCFTIHGGRFLFLHSERENAALRITHQPAQDVNEIAYRLPVRFLRPPWRAPEV